MAVYHRTQRLQIYGEKPEVTKLFGDRYRMVVRCKAARDTEAWYNANKDQIFASFGTLYSAQMSVDGIDPRSGEAYPDMCLVSNSASYTQTGEYVISFVYETLTAVWTKEQGDEVTSTDNGLRVLERSEVAKVDGFPIVQLSSPNSSKVVLSGMGNASNYFVLLVKANSANTIYWRATNEVLATYNGSFTTANTDQWEYKVIYTPISIDQLEIGYDGTNYSTFDLSEFYLVSQSSDWQNNIVESFIEFEVTVDNSSPFTDTVVFTGSNGNTATGTNVQGGGTGSISSPYDEDDVGIATITDGGKTLYLAGFKDETQSETNVQIGRVVSRWAEAGTLNRSEDKVGSQQAITIQAIGELPATPVGYSLARTSVGNYEGFQTNDYTFLEPSILSVSTPKVGGQQRVQVQAFNLSEATVVSEVSEVTASHELVDITTSDVEGIPTRNFTFDVDNFDVRSTTDNGLLTITRTDLGTVAYSDGNVGTDTITDGAITLYLAGEEIDNGNTIKKRVSRWMEAGVLSVQTSSGPAGMPNTVVKTVTSFVTAPTSSGITLTKSTNNTNGLEQYEYRFLEKADGTSPVDTEGSPVTLVSYEKNIQVRKAGVVSASSVSVTGGTVAVLSVVPPSIESVKADVTIKLTTDNSVAAPVAYNLSNTSCSVSTTNTSITPVGVEQGSSLTVSVFNTKTNSGTQSFPNHYKTGADVNASYSTAAQIVRDDDNIIGEALNQTLDMNIILTGSTTEPATSGVYQEDVDPVFFDADGTQYFRKTRYNIPTP
jgi:hypothetical protein